MSGLYLILLVGLVPYLSYAWVSVNRGVRDSWPRGVLELCGDEHATRSFWKCTCDKDYNTIMSKDDLTYMCRKPFQVGCYLSLMETSQTHLLTRGSERKQIFPSMRFNNPIHRVYVWNLSHGNKGKWYDITKETVSFFNVEYDTKTKNYFLETLNMNMNLWKGQLIKVEFGYPQRPNKPCLTVKVKGGIKYPFNLNRFKSRFPKPHTTMKPTTHTVPPTRKPTAIKTHPQPSTGKPSTVATSTVPPTRKPTSVKTHPQPSTGKPTTIATSTVPPTRKPTAVKTHTESATGKPISVITSIEEIAVV